MRRTIIVGCFGAVARARALKFVREAPGYQAIALFRPCRGVVVAAERYGDRLSVSSNNNGSWWSATKTWEDAMSAAERKHATRATAPAPSGVGS